MPDSSKKKCDLEVKVQQRSQSLASSTGKNVFKLLPLLGLVLSFCSLPWLLLALLGGGEVLGLTWPGSTGLQAGSVLSSAQLSSH